MFDVAIGARVDIEHLARRIPGDVPPKHTGIATRSPALDFVAHTAMRRLPKPH